MTSVSYIMSPLHTHLYGPKDGQPLFAIHGLTGHGGRFRHWSATQVPHARVVAPDLLGHGRSSYCAPWSIEAQVKALADTFRTHVHSPAVLLGHSYGGLLAVHLAHVLGDVVTGLLLLDPAIGTDRALLSERAENTVARYSYPDRDAVWAEKKNDAWGRVAPDVLEVEITEHLVSLPQGGFYWRVSPAAVITSWSELARPAVLPPLGLPTTVVVADRVSPSYFSPSYENAVRERLGDSLQIIHWDSDHMVVEEHPHKVGALARSLLG